MIRVIVLLIILAIFNVAFFLLNCIDALSSVQWVTFAFINCGILLPFIVSFLPIAKPEVKAGMVSTAIVYGVVELIVGIVLMACRVNTLVWPLISQMVMLGIVLVICLGVYNIDKRKNQ